MKIVLLNGASFEIDISPVDFYSVYKLVRDGKLEAVLTDTAPVANVRRIDAERTFGDLIKNGYHDTERPPAAEKAVVDG